jgi:hypothetical protein
MSVIGGRAENICSLRVFLSLIQSGHRAKHRAAHAHFSLADRHPTTEVARADAELEKLQQLSRRPRKEQTSFQKQKLAL